MLVVESKIFDRLKGLISTKLQRRRAAFRLSMFFNSYIFYRITAPVLIGSFTFIRDNQPQTALAMVDVAAARLLAFRGWCWDQGVNPDEFLRNSIHGMLRDQAVPEALDLEAIFKNLLRESQPSEEMIRQERQELEKAWQDMLDKETYRVFWMC